MKRAVVPTADGSVTVSVPDANITYHSIHGAIRESQHVFIGAGLHHLIKTVSTDRIRIFEMGVGTGLNVLLTLTEAKHLQQPVYYEAVELYPLELSFIDQLNYSDQLQQPGLQAYLEKIHTSGWGEEIVFSEFFSFKKHQTDLSRFTSDQAFHLIYYDAFAPSAQPELWTAEIFGKLFNMLLPGGILTTYCSKGDVRRAMQAAGFSIEKIPGPPGKREMVRATRK